MQSDFHELFTFSQILSNYGKSPCHPKLQMEILLQQQQQKKLTFYFFLLFPGYSPTLKNVHVILKLKKFSSDSSMIFIQR